EESHCWHQWGKFLPMQILASGVFFRKSMGPDWNQWRYNFLLDAAHGLVQKLATLVTLFIFSTVSQSDCYVVLWLPTATCEKMRTKTVNNCKNPVWNETFYYRIQTQVKVNDGTGGCRVFWWK
uniref:C2 domain-containing protein n=1 Tax=Varanus komodoensis TaxID=61221 RepID=A0A8D2KX53_VARKO